MSREATYIERIDRYAEWAISSPEDACLYARQACQRHLDDRVKERRKSSRLTFDETAIAKICDFGQAMPHVAGDWALGGRNTIKLEDWQVFIYGSVFGWLKQNRKRRFRYVYCEIPRKMSKSTMLAITGLYMTIFDGEPGAQVLCSATTEEQAHHVFRPAWEMVAQTPILREKYGVQLGGTPVNPGPIYVPSSRSIFKTMIGIPRDGANNHLGIIDEYHEHKSDGIYQTLKTGNKARSQPILWVITTAGSDTSGPCHQLRDDATKLLGGTLTDDSTFSTIYTIDDGDEWTTEAALRKANPNFGVSVDAEGLLADMQQAINSARLQNDFKTKHLNIWVGAKASWMNMEKWAACADPISEDDFKGEECWMGVDLSQRNDFTSVVKLFRRGSDYYLFSRHYLPEARIYDPVNKHYRQWLDTGHLIEIPGEVIDYNVVRDDILEDQDKFRAVALGYDPMYATQFALDLLEAGVNAIEVKQIPSQLTEAMEDLAGVVGAGSLHHDNNLVMNWMMGNVVVKSHSRYGIKPDKERAGNKIDGPSAAITAMVMEHTQAVEEQAEWPSGVLVNF